MSKHVLSIMHKCICMELGKGNILVVSAMIMVILFMALVVDLACLHAVRSELQDAADAAALAAAGKITALQIHFKQTFTTIHLRRIRSSPQFPH